MTKSETVTCVLTRKIVRYSLARKLISGLVNRLPACAPKTQTRQNGLFSYFSWLLSKHPMFVRTSHDVYLEKATQFIGKYFCRPGNLYRFGLFKI